ncbi:lantibiotic dehydratase [Micromonospora yangpuensis]|uniref:lantibiotic dehydratase n=1 Tax=Micromonospora yangpuensis TaxID=683228 RepID=UPI000B88E8A1|nr:lantibiotic dehydratase [Micromonospora yangpuensis]
MLQALSRRLATDGAADRLVVAVTPDAEVAEGRIWFGHPGRERIRGLLLTPPVRTVVEAVGAGGPLAEVGRRLPRDAAVTFDRLVEIGLVEIRPPFADQAADHLHDLRAWLGPDAPAAGPLRALADALDTYPAPGTGACRRRELHHRIRTEFETVSGQVGGPPLPARNLFRENAVFTADPVRLGGPAWRPAVADLHVVHRFLALFQHSTVVRLVAHRIFVDRYGAHARVGLLTLHRELSRLTVDAAPATALAELAGLLHPGEPPDPAGSTLAEVRLLHRLRQEALATLWAGPETGQDGITVDPARVRALAAGWPPWVRPAPALACFVQQVPAADGLRLVLNGVGAGHGAVRSRVHRLLAKVAPEAADPVDPPGSTALSGPDPAGYLAELTGLFGSNVNLRSPAVGFEICHPGMVSARPPQQRIPLDDLVVTPDAATPGLRLRRRSDDGAVRIAYTGMMAGARLPRLARFLVHLFGDVPNAAAPTAQIFTGTPEHPTGTVRRRPRLSIGRVTVSRASWRVRADLVPGRAKGVDDAGYLLTLAAWFAEHRIPQRSYVTASRPAPVKPVYLDLANVPLVRLFERLLRGPDAVLTFQEALPQLADAPSYGTEGRHVTEYVVEIGPS